MHTIPFWNINLPQYDYQDQNNGFSYIKQQNSQMNVNNLVDYLIRPPKFTYSINDLGPSIFDLNNIIYQRIDFCVKKQNNSKIQASLWKRKDHKNDQLKLSYLSPFLIYLHCNCGSRVQAMQHVNKSLELGYNFIAYDSQACGQSSGQYISLGYYQIFDLEAIIRHIVLNFISNPQIILWGRSMGAVTSMNYLIKNKVFSNYVKVAVLDSPFINLKQVICQIVNKKIGVPKLLIDLFVSYLDPLVQEKAKFKISQFDLRKQVNKIKCPLILMASKFDELVPFGHLEQIYNLHQGKKSIFYLEQSHTDQRTNETISKIFRTISRYFLAERKSEDIHFESFNNLIQKKVQLTDPKNYRLTEFTQPKADINLNSGQKSKSHKKITITCPIASGKKLQQMNKFETYSEFKNQNESFSKTEAKKKKLSLNYSNSSLSYNKSNTNINITTTCRPIQLFKSYQRNKESQKRDENRHKVSVLLKQKTNIDPNNYVSQKRQDQKPKFANTGHRRINSSLSEREKNIKKLNKQNSMKKTISQFTQVKQVRRDVRILNLISTNTS